MVRDGTPISLGDISDWFITKQQLNLMGDHCNNIWFNERYKAKNARGPKSKD